MHDLQSIAQYSKAQWLGAPAPGRTIRHLSTDSRKLYFPATTLFIALRTPQRDGHAWIGDAYARGCRAFLVSEEVDVAPFPEGAFLLVKDSLAALQSIAAGHRRELHMPVIGVTGSNGKTVVKEWLYELLSPDMRVHRSPKSFNSQIGVPLSVWMLDARHELGIIEAGISQAGEMEKLQAIIRPEIGIFTNIGEAHSEGFMNERQKVNEKLLLFRHARQMVYCADHALVHECILQYRQRITSSGGDSPELFYWGTHTDAPLRITGQERKELGTVISGIHEGRAMQITIPFTDAASVENAIHCWAIMLMLGHATPEALERFAHLHPVAMRLELRHGIHDTTVINDSYNSDLSSFSIALDYLSQQSQHQKRTVILSDMLQIGRPDAELYEAVAQQLTDQRVDRLIAIGPALSRNKATFRKFRKLRSFFFAGTDEFLRSFHLQEFANEAILLKGARMFRFEKISKLLEEETHQTVLSINLSALTHNFNVFRKLTRPGVKLMAMVKAFSYGSGSHEIAQALQYAGADYLSVAYADEGVALRKAGITLPVMVMSPDAVAFDRMIAWKLEPEIFNMRSLRLFTEMAQNLGVEAYPIHIKLDTGMHRLGFLPEDLDGLILALHQNPHVRVVSIFSHLAGSEAPALEGFTREQTASFEASSAQLLDALPGKPLRHLCNTAGISRYPELHYDMVRLGIGLYGIDTGGATQRRLQRIGELRTTIAQIKTVQPGDTVGYSRGATITRPSRIATISIGYADGYPRAMGHGAAHVLIHGRPAPTVGVICMDMCMVDVTDIPEAREGDRAIVFGPGLPIEALAAQAGTIAYEMMTGISQRVKREYVSE